ncbi:MAG: hypothetical protein PX638_05825 [Microcystis sp. M53599_WE4]|nr:hypothetical protein [Microcystis sp. LE17-20D]MCZ8064563.1 hypothetical protein [Microcystis sp. LE17-20D]MCZ8159438.1 hypothetical protein [Microcystis sp. LE19-196.1B]MDJ0558621.1 hypothetical protein [Microcystis sp. M53599_WE4]
MTFKTHLAKTRHFQREAMYLTQTNQIPGLEAREFNALGELPTE